MIPGPCTHCGGTRERLNGLYFRHAREREHVSLSDMARICSVSISSLSRMELGEQQFLPKYADLYESYLNRLRRSGQEW